MKTDKRSARMVGVLILTATVTYILGTGLIGPILGTPGYLAGVYPNRVQLISGVLLRFVDAASVVAIGVLLFPVLRKHGEGIALGYAGTRIVECACLVIGGLGTLSLIALSQETLKEGTQNVPYALTLSAVLVAGSYAAYLIGMIALGLGSLPFCYLLYRSRLIPRPLSVLGLIGYAALFVGCVLELFGQNLAMMHYVPGGLFELILPLWLIVKGFNSSAVVSGPAAADINESVGRSLSRA